MVFLRLILRGTLQGTERPHNSFRTSLKKLRIHSTLRYPYSYLRYIYEKIPLAATLEDYEAMLPWNIDPMLIGHLGED